MLGLAVNVEACPLFSALNLKRVSLPSFYSRIRSFSLQSYRRRLIFSVIGPRRSKKNWLKKELNKGNSVLPRTSLPEVVMVRGAILYGKAGLH